MHASGSRRQVLLGAGASAVSLAMPFAARAQQAGTNPLGQLLGQALPAELRSLIPAQAFQAAEFVDTLISLEREAGTLKLPKSKLSLGEGALPVNPELLYELALPRLVALVDRAELRNIPFADRAGALLAKLHDTQHVAPEMFAVPMASGPASTTAGNRLSLDGGPDDAARPSLPRIDFPLPDLKGSDAPAVPPTGSMTSEPVVQPLPQQVPTPDGVDTAPAVPAQPAAPITINRSLKFPDLAEEYAAMFATAEFNTAHSQTANWHLTMMRQARSRYEGAARRTGVPWFFIAAIHGLEASFNFRAHFHNGDYPLTSRTRQVPAGRPLVWLPPSDWEASTVDALRLMGFAGASDWSLPRTLYRLEAFNGFGYRRLGRASPYLWSFSNHYSRGKFVADGRFNAQARSQQCGSAVMLKLLAEAGEIAIS